MNRRKALELARTIIASSLMAKLGYAGAVSQTTPRKRSFKGWELYSWTERGIWRYALLIGTNRSKETLEIKAPAATLPDLMALKKELAELSSDEFVFWQSPRMAGFALPPAAILETVRQHCQTLGLQLEIQTPR